MDLISHIKNLLLGLGIAGKHLGRHAITIQYPEQRYDIPEGSRGIVVLLSDKKTGELNCTACELCMRACPTAAIRIDSHRDENKRKVLDQFVVDNGLCCFCGLCEEACNFSALKMATKYEFSCLDKDDLTWDVKKLQEVGLDVDYVDTRKKKKPKAAKPASDKAAPTKPAAPAKDDTETAAEEKPPIADMSVADKPADTTTEVADTAVAEPQPQPATDVTTPTEPTEEKPPSSPETPAEAPNEAPPEEKAAPKTEDKKEGDQTDASA